MVGKLMLEIICQLTKTLYKKENTGNQHPQKHTPIAREPTIYDAVILPKISKEGEGYTDSRFEDTSNFDEAGNIEKDPLSICDSKMDQKIL